MIYRHGDRSYAIGMAWSDFVGRTEARAYLKRAGKPWQLAEVAGDATGPDGVAVGIAHDQPLCPGVASGAMAIGQLFPNALIRQSLPDGRIWVARLAAGVPCAGRDEVLSTEEAAARLAEPPLRDAILVGDADGARLSVDEALALYEEQEGDGRIDKAQARAIRLQPAPSLMRPLAATAVLVLVLGGLAASLWTWRGQLRDAQSRRAAFERLTVSQADAGRRQAERQQRIAAFRRMVDERRLALAQAQEDPRAQWAVWETARRQLPLSVNGYVAEEMACDRTQCTVHWRSTGPRVRLVDQAAIANWIEDDTPMGTPRSRVDLPPAADAHAGIRQARSAFALQLALAQALQFEGGGTGLGPVRPETVAPPADAGLAPVVVGMTGELRLAASGPAALVRANDLMRALQRLPVRLESLHWTQLSSGPATTIEARWIYVNPQ
jgi:hypothetical protein